MIQTLFHEPDLEWTSIFELSSLIILTILDIVLMTENAPFTRLPNQNKVLFSLTCTELRCDKHSYCSPNSCVMKSTSMLYFYGNSRNQNIMK